MPASFPPETKLARLKDRLAGGSGGVFSLEILARLLEVTRKRTVSSMSPMYMGEQMHHISQRSFVRKCSEDEIS